MGVAVNQELVESLKLQVVPRLQRPLDLHKRQAVAPLRVNLGLNSGHRHIRVIEHGGQKYLSTSVTCPHDIIVVWVCNEAFPKDKKEASKHGMVDNEMCCAHTLELFLGRYQDCRADSEGLS